MKPLILCVEDNEDTCELLRIILPNFTVITASTIREALPLITPKVFALYILDSWLPDGYGSDLCRAIRDHDHTTPIIFYSGVDFPVEKQAAADCGATAYLVKPVEAETIIRTVAALTGCKAKTG